MLLCIIGYLKILYCIGSVRLRKKFININQCHTGMMVAETIYNDYGAIVVLEKTILDTHIIKKLKNLGFSKLRIFDDSTEIIEANSTEIFNAQYEENLNVVKEVLHDISNGKNLNVDEIENVSETMILKINENRDIVRCINQIRDIDDYTYSHSINVSMLSMLLAKWMKYDLKHIKLINQAGLLHDIGKVKISPDILNKHGSLTEDEFNEMKKHPTLGYKLVQGTPGISNHVCMGVLMHHERDDGSGYPFGLKDKSIHNYAKIIAVADIYDAMTSDRVYKFRKSPFEVFEIMENDSFGVLDTKIVSTFLLNIAAYYIGDLVKLSTGEIAEIIHINSRHISQPLVKVNEKFIDLSTDLSIKISELL